ncbi:unnamed protein product, partial [Discosporangium mesarthrocarpum]
QVPFASPVPPDLYGLFAAVLMAAGLGFMAMFFIQQMKVAGSGQSILKDMPLALTSSILLGFGVLFVLLWSGVYV